MHTILRHIALLLSTLLGSLAALAQNGPTGVFIPKDGLVYFHPGDTVAIFSSLKNEGKMGSLKNANVLFFGQLFHLDGADAQLTVRTQNGVGIDGEGGNFIFQQPNPLTGFSQQQTIVGNYNAAANTGSSFPNLTINNASGVWLDSSSAKVRETLTFKNGKLILNDQNMVVGHNNAGNIMGYDAQRYVVTGTSRYGGYLIREKVSAAAGLLVYPVGADAIRYTPMAFTVQQSAGMVGGRVSNTVLSGLDAGIDLRDSTTNTVWELVQKDSVPLAITLQLQHGLQSEGAQFAAARNRSFISLFGNLAWGRNGLRSTPVSPGILTTGPALANAAVNTISMNLPANGTSAWMAKFAYAAPDTSIVPGPIDTGRTIITLKARRTSGTEVLAEFTTSREYKNVVMYLQRRLDNANSFTTLSAINSTAPNGTSNTPIDYSKVDANNTHTGLSHYRVIAQNTAGQFTVSNEVVVGGPQTIGNLVLTVWPVPTKGRYWIGINGNTKVKYFNVFGSNGQLIRRVLVNNRSVIEQYEAIQDLYYLAFYDENEKLLETRKVVVQN